MQRHATQLILAVGLLALSCGGQGGGGGKDDPRRVSGNYALTYDDLVTLKLTAGGATREVTQHGLGGIADFGTIDGKPVTLDLTAFCARPEVKCPSESFWSKVAIAQPDLASSASSLQRLLVVNDTVHALDAGVRAAALGGLVNHDDDDRFLIGLGANAGANQACIALALSLAGGRFSHQGEHVETSMEYRTPQGRACAPSDGGVDAGAGPADGGAPVPCTLTEVKRLVVPPGAAVSGIADGTVLLGFAGGCAFGPILVGAALTMETGFTGERTGDYDPPPFTPAEVVLPDGGLPESALGGGSDAGLAPDAGADGGS